MMHYLTTKGMVVLGVMGVLAGWAVVEFVLWIFSFIHVSIG